MKKREITTYTTETQKTIRGCEEGTNFWTHPTYWDWVMKKLLGTEFVQSPGQGILTGES